MVIAKFTNNHNHYSRLRFDGLYKNFEFMIFIEIGDL